MEYASRTSSPRSTRSVASPIRIFFSNKTWSRDLVSHYRPPMLEYTASCTLSLDSQLDGDVRHGTNSEIQATMTQLVFQTFHG